MSDLVFFTRHFWEWALVVFFLLFLFYCARAIKNEKNIFLKNLKSYFLGNFKIPCPPWWGLKKSDQKSLIFERTDTRYDWQARFFLVRDENLPLEKLLVKKIHEKEILFDEENSDIPDDRRISREFFLGDMAGYEFTRVEGTATRKGIDRLYLDFALIRDKKNNLILQCESESSVLNGMVEGPYFEEVLKKISPAKSSAKL